MTDQQLLNEYAHQGSEHAFETLVQRHVHLVFATAARHLGGAGPAEEVTQNVFIALAGKATQLRDHVALAGWLHQATLQEARRWWRGELRRQRREHTAAELGTTMNEAPSLLATLTGLLDEGLLELRQMDRQALMLRYCENLSQREVAARLGVREDAARKRIGKALERLTRFFQRRGYAVGSAATTVSVLRAAAQMAPAGLAATAARAALSAGAVSKAGGLTMLLGKLMALTKTQTAALSLLVAAGPVISQWHAARVQGAERRRLTSELTNLRQDINRRERSLARVGRQLRYSQADVAALAAGGPAGTEDAGRGAGRDSISVGRTIRLCAGAEAPALATDSLGGRDAAARQGQAGARAAARAGPGRHPLAGAAGRPGPDGGGTDRGDRGGSRGVRRV